MKAFRAAPRDYPRAGIVLPVRVLPEWGVAGGRVRSGLYTIPFDLAIDHFKDQLGFDQAWRDANLRSTVALEARMTFRGEARIGDELQVETRIIDADEKRMHLAQQLARGEELLVLRESLAISFDLQARRTCPFADDILANISALFAAQRQLAAWSWVGRQAASVAALD